MRITRTTITKGSDTESVIEIDTEAAPYNLPAQVVEDQHGGHEVIIAEPRVPTSEEYAIIRDVLDLPHPDDILTDVQMNQAHKTMMNLHKGAELNNRVSFPTGPTGAITEPPVFKCEWFGCPGVNAPHSGSIHPEFKNPLA